MSVNVMGICPLQGHTTTKTKFIFQWYEYVRSSVKPKCFVLPLHLCSMCLRKRSSNKVRQSQESIKPTHKFPTIGIPTDTLVPPVLLSLIECWTLELARSNHLSHQPGFVRPPAVMTSKTLFLVDPLTVVRGELIDSHPYRTEKLLQSNGRCARSRCRQRALRTSERVSCCIMTQYRAREREGRVNNTSYPCSQFLLCATMCVDNPLQGQLLSAIRTCDGPQQDETSWHHSVTENRVRCLDQHNRFLYTYIIVQRSSCLVCDVTVRWREGSKFKYDIG